MSVFWWVDIENSAGVKQGSGPVKATRWRSVKRLDRAGDFEFEVPATDTNAATIIQQKRIARCKAVIGGATVEVGAGIIETIALRVSGDQAFLVVSGPDLLAELRRALVDKRVIAALVSYFYQPTYVNDDEIPYKLLTNYANAKLASTWTLADETGSTIGASTAVTGTEVYARYRDESVLNALIRVAGVVGEHLRLGSGRTVEWLNGAADFAASGVRAVYDAEAYAVLAYSYLVQIDSIERVEDTQGLVNRVILYGSGEGDNRLTLAAVDEWPDGTALSSSPSNRTIGGRSYDVAFDATSSALDNTLNCLQDGDSITAYGVHEAVLQFKNIAPVSNTDSDLTNAANQLLRAGYEHLLLTAEPIESYRLTLAGCNSILRVGTTIPAQASRYVDGERPINIDATLNILEATVELDAHEARTSGLVVSTGVRQPQSTGDVIVNAVQDSYVAAAHPQMGPTIDTLPFGPEEIDYTHDAILNFWLSDAITTIEQILMYFRIDALRSTVITHDDLTGVSHSHSTPIYGATILTNVGLDSIGRLANGGSSGVADQNIGTNFGGYHLHPQHLGIVEEVSGNTYDDSEIDIYANGGLASGSVTDESDGWYSIDLTADLVTNGRPDQVKNTVTLIDNRSAISISSISKSVVTVSVTTSTNHGLSTGDAVWVAGTSAYNGHHANITVTGTTTFTFVALNGSGSESTGTIIKYKTARIQAQIERRMTIQSIAYTL